MRFIADGMLGGLARWLRILGHTVVYESNSSDDKLLSKAAAQEMTLLTRDEELHRRALARNIPSILVSGESEDERLAQMARSLGISLEIDMERTLCPECGGSLRETPKVDVSSIVPATSLELYAQFWKCQNHACGKVYWMGSHWKQINQTLTRARKLAGLEA